ncbi:MAG: 1,4-alpha-glucan branching enzyme [Lachnospiraceae bacterium]|nr:1,4-alpha-glucan branching enzyme [Lachnospiraceae bacterium]
MDFYGFYTGKIFDAHKYLGAHTEVQGVTFRTFAPAASKISLIAECTGWEELPMHKVHDGNFWEVYAADAKPGMMYKYRIYGRDGSKVDHCDPYGYGMELRPRCASIVRQMGSYRFQDETWMKRRSRRLNEALNIYEIHAGSFRKPATCTDEQTQAGKGNFSFDINGSISDPSQQEQIPTCNGSTCSDTASSDNCTIHQGQIQTGNGSFCPDAARQANSASEWYNYEELADLLIPYLKEQGYNYIELMPLNEHPCDESWGYQSTGFFSPTSRYGTAEQLMRLVDRCHQNGIGVLLDFVPVHFAVDDYGLANYDGTPLYEYPNAAVGVSEWGSCNFMHSRGEVRSFLQSTANYWLSEYHMDGLRMDAISRIIYWQGDQARGVNGNAVDFIRYMNRGLHRLHPAAILAAEDSTSFSGITKSAEEGGLDFDYKWDMGWMNDTLDFFRTAPEYRSENYHKLTFSMMYFYDAHHLLPLSHDENVHGKATILQKMSGDYEDKFRQGRALYMYMYAHPGKKLNFMGGEIGQLREWDEKREQDWDILRYPKHSDFQKFMRELNRLYLAHPAFYERDYEQDGFAWIDCHEEERCIYAFSRSSSPDTSEQIVTVMNLSGQPQAGYRFSVAGAKELKTLLDSEDSRFCGDRKQDLKALKADADFGEFQVDLLPFEVIYFEV